jgi:hypothetical protein
MIFGFESILLITACLVVLVGVQVRWQAIVRQRRARREHSGVDLASWPAPDPITPTVFPTRFP